MQCPKSEGTTHFVFHFSKETIYRYVMDNPHVTSDKVATYIGLSQESAKKYLRQLVALGYIIPEGANRNRTYSVKV